MAVKHFIVFGILLAKSFGSGVPVPSQSPETAEKEAEKSGMLTITLNNFSQLVRFKMAS